MALGLSELVRFEALERRVEEQQRHIEAQDRQIEALQTALRARSPAALAHRNAARQAEARRLDNAIASVLASRVDGTELTAKELGKALERNGFNRVIPERTLRRHLNSARGHGHT